MTAYDQMPDMELYQPVTVQDAAELAARMDGGAWLLAGGQDTYGWLKDRAKTTAAMIDLKGIDALKGIREIDDGVEIGALATLREITQNTLIGGRYPLLREAASVVASPQIRNMGTLGGNLCQDARCWYYRRGLSCYRAGGNLCYADAPSAMNREHALFGASRCVAVTPSDTAIALAALEATMVATSQRGSREIPVSDFFVGPDLDIRNMTALNADELLVSVRLPSRWAGADFHFEKVSDRNVWDFALVSIAAALRMRGSVIDDARLVCGGLACTPHRLEAVERAIVGQPRSQAAAADLAGLASAGARPLNHNHFKVPLMQNLVRRALRNARAG